MNTEAAATAGMDTAARMTRVRTVAQNAFTEPPSTAPTPQILKKKISLSFPRKMANVFKMFARVPVR